MHPLLKGGTRIALYMLAWVPVGVLLAGLLYQSAGFLAGQAALIALPLCLVYAFVCLSPWYLCRVLPIGPGRASKILRSHLAAAVVAALFWVVAAKGWGMALSRWDSSIDPRLSRQLPMLFIAGVLLYALAVSLHYVLLSFQISQQAEVQAQRARVLAHEAEIRALKAQINPHFLFNCLHSISALTASEPAKARDMCIRLSDFLRSTLSLGDKEMIPLSEELALTRTYLGVEQVRFGSRLRVEEEIEPVCGLCSVPPLLMQPLVENAIKHGVAGLIDGATVRLEVECNGGRLRVRVENEFDVEAPARARSGLGLANVKNRLRARYDHRARLDIEVIGNYFLVELNLPCEEHSQRSSLVEQAFSPASGDAAHG